MHPRSEDQSQYDRIIAAILAALNLTADSDHRNVGLSADAETPILTIQQQVAELLDRSQPARARGVEVSATSHDGKPAIRVGGPFDDKPGLLDELVIATTTLGSSSRVVGDYCNDGRSFVAYFKD